MTTACYRVLRIGASVVVASLSALPVRAEVRSADTNGLCAMVAHHAEASLLLTRDTIRVGSRGTMPVQFAAAADMLTRSNLLDRVQEEYARSLPDGQEPEFVLQPAGENRWSFVNRHAQYSEVHEVARVLAADSGSLTAVFYACGERFFGMFESLTVVRATPSADGRVDYTVEVFAYPQQPACRFVIRHLGLVERFFRNKTKELEDVTARVCVRLCTDSSG